MILYIFLGEIGITSFKVYKDTTITFRLKSTKTRGVKMILKLISFNLQLGCNSHSKGMYTRYYLPFLFGAVRITGYTKLQHILDSKVGKMYCPNWLKLWYFTLGLTIEPFLAVLIVCKSRTCRCTPLLQGCCKPPRFL